MKEKMLGELVKATTSDGLILNGFLSAPPRRPKAILIWLHGLGSSFYRHFGPDFIQPFHRKNVAVLLANTRGHDIVSRVTKTNGTRLTIGSTYERISEAYRDIEGWVRLAERYGFKKVFLAGHSLGATKVGLFVKRNRGLGGIIGTIYASPPDMWNENYRAKRQQQGVKVAVKLLRAGKGDTLMPKGFMQYDQSVEAYFDKMSPTRRNNVFDFVRGNFNWAQRFRRPQLLIYGDHDEPVKGDDPQSALQVFKTKVPWARVVCIKGANHGYVGKRPIFYQVIARFVGNALKGNDRASR